MASAPYSSRSDLSFIRPPPPGRIVDLPDLPLNFFRAPGLPEQPLYALSSPPTELTNSLLAPIGQTSPLRSGTFGKGVPPVAHLLIRSIDRILCRDIP